MRLGKVLRLAVDGDTQLFFLERDVQCLLHLAAEKGSVLYKRDLRVEASVFCLVKPQLLTYVYMDVYILYTKFTYTISHTYSRIHTKNTDRQTDRQTDSLNH